MDDIDADKTAHIDDLADLQAAGRSIHCLVVTGGDGGGRVVELKTEGQVLGRSADADVRIEGEGVSGRHCRLSRVGDLALVQDLESTNGVFVDGQRVVGAAGLPVGSVLQVGRILMRHELRDETAFRRDGAITAELKRAAEYVLSLLPEPLVEGPVRTAWSFVPSEHLGGDVFGYHALDDGRMAIYLLDVCGHGTAAALHSVSVVNLLRGESLRGVDFARPAEVLNRLNGTFQMEDHGDMYFTMWYGVYEPPTRTLRYASAGHPPSLLRRPGETDLLELRTPAPPVGMLPDVVFEGAETTVPPDGRLYVFSDGVYEVRVEDRRRWTLSEFEAFLQSADQPAEDEPAYVEREVRERMRDPAFDDDFSFLAVRFP